LAQAENDEPRQRAPAITESVLQQPGGESGLPAWRVSARQVEAEQLQRAWREVLTALSEVLPADPTAANALRSRLAELLDPAPGVAELNAFVRLLRSEQAPAPSLAGLPVHAEPDVARELRDQASYHAHLRERARDVDALHQTLSRETADTIRRNRQISELLDGLVSRLELASELPEVMRPDDRMIEELRRIAAAHDLVAARFEAAQATLRSVKEDNERLARELEHVRTLSLTDEGTGLPNRRAFDRQLKAEVARVGREAHTFSIAMLDLDGFKAVNDRHGHGAGDEILRRYASHVLGGFREHDLVARYGGEEFAILLPGADLDGAERALQKARERITDYWVEWEGLRLPLPTFSAGIAQYQSGESAEVVVQRADQAMYTAKHKGRNRIEQARPLRGPRVPAAASDHRGMQGA
jgi:diguanylate cyclase (GGDEF)-like protein